MGIGVNITTHLMNDGTNSPNQVGILHKVDLRLHLYQANC